MSKFRKKPVVIDAQQFHGDYVSANVIIQWINESVGFDPKNGNDPPAMYYYGDLTIRTLEGDMEAKSGDWIIRGVKGEFYPCKPDIFAATYEPLDSIGGQ
jgi:hypothetical protein